MPLLPTEAARTAAPVPPKTSQNVPKNSATAALPVFICSTTTSVVSYYRGGGYPLRRHSYHQRQAGARRRAVQKTAGDKKGARTGAQEGW